MLGVATSHRRAAVVGALLAALAVGSPGASVGGWAATVGSGDRPSTWWSDDGGDEVVQIDTVLQIDSVLQVRLASALTPAVVADPVEALAVLSVHVSLRDAGAAGIPVSVLTAYRQAEANLATALPSCHLPWWLLAGIGRIESGHAEGGRVDAAGTTRGRILGPVLDGSQPGTAVVRDTDGGAMDGDPVFDRAVGPMQFLPGTWKSYARDGNGDGVVNPYNVFDAATTAGIYLCRNGGDLSQPANIATAVLHYNHSDSYLRSVLTWGAAYRDNATPAADQPGTIPTDTSPRQPDTPAPIATPTSPVPTTTPSEPPTTPEAGPTPTPTPTPSPTGAAPSATPTPEPTPEPTAPPTPTPTPTPSPSSSAPATGAASSEPATAAASTGP